MTLIVIREEVEVTLLNAALESHRDWVSVRHVECIWMSI